MSEEILEKNLSAMGKWYPDFVRLIREKKDIEDDTEVFTEMSWDNEKIFQIKKGNRKLYLGGKRNAKKPVEMWRERLGKINQYSPVFLFGIGNGAYLKELIADTEESVYIIVYEPSINIFMRLLYEIDLAEAIENRPIAFIIEELNEVEYEPVLRKVLALQNMAFLKEEVHPNYREFYLEKIVEKIRALDSYIMSIKIEYNSGARFQRNMVQNVFSNMKYLCEGYHVKQIAGAIPPNGTAILVSAGPSLNKNMHELKNAKNKAFILAVDTVVKPLLKNGIIPDAIVTIDPDKPVELIEMKEAEEIPIIAPATAQYTLLDHQKKAKKFFYFDGYYLPAHIYQINEKVLPEAASGGSVACSGFSLLYKMGFKTIILAGQDLAYTGNKSYVDGAFQEIMPEEDTADMVMVKGNYEDKLPTELVLKVYLEWFEMYIEGMKKHNDVRVVNATEGGAFIKGTELATLHDIIKETCVKEINYSKIIDGLEPDLSEKERKNALEYLYSIPEQLDKMNGNAEQIRKAYKKILNICKNGRIEEKECEKQLHKIKKLIKKLVDKKELYQLADITLSPMEFIVLSEYYYKGEDEQKEIQETARKGVLFSEMMMKCFGLMKELAEELLLSIELK